MSWRLSPCDDDDIREQVGNPLPYEEDATDGNLVHEYNHEYMLLIPLLRMKILTEAVSKCPARLLCFNCNDVVSEKTPCSKHHPSNLYLYPPSQLPFRLLTIQERLQNCSNIVKRRQPNF